MNKTELREIINNGENSGVEFKRDVEDNRALAKELVAFANLQGGRVLLGVDKNRTVFGLTRFDPGTGAGDTPRTYDRLEEFVMQACREAGDHSVFRGHSRCRGGIGRGSCGG